MSGGVAVGVTVNSGAITVEGVISTPAGAGGSYTSTAAAAIGSVISAGTIEVNLGGSTTGTVLLSSTSLYARPEELVFGGTATGTLVESGASQIVFSGEAVGTLIRSGGSQGLTVGATALNTVVLAGGTVAGTGGTLAYTEAAGVTSSVLGALVGSMTLLQSGPGTLALAGSLATFSGTVLISGGSVELTSSGAAGGATMVGFAAGAVGSLRIDGAGPFTTPISGLVQGDVIDLAALAFAGSSTPATIDGDLVTVVEGGVAETLTVRGASDGTLSLAGDGSGGTLLTNARAQAIVSSGQTVTIGAGQSSNFVAILSGGTLDVQNGGLVVSAGIAGVETVSGGVDSLGFVSSGGLLTVAAGGQASGALVQGSEVVLPGGTAIGTTVFSGGFSRGLILSGGAALATTVSSGGYLTVGGAASPATGLPQVGSASFTTVSAGGTLVDMAGGTTSGTVLLGPTGSVSRGAFESVSSGASTTATMVMAGAQQSVFSGMAVGTVLASGGTQAIAGGTASNTIAAAGSVVFDDGTLAYSETAGASTTFEGLLVGFGTVVQSGPGTLALPGTLAAMGKPGSFDTFSGTVVISGGTLELVSVGSGGSATIDFATSSGVLRIDGAEGPGNPIKGFAPGDLIDLAGLGFAGNTAPQINANSVTVTEGSLSETLQLAGASSGSFRLFSDAAGGTALQIACYLPGTRIATPAGDIPIEALVIGDPVMTLSGRAKPIRWIGRRSYAGPFLAAKQRLMPVRIRTGALGSGLPRRDLLVSPEHALHLDGVLIPARCLVNGSSIIQETTLDRVDYLHIELDGHAIIFAEGAAAESFIDDGSRGMFSNADEYAALYPDAQPVARFYAPRLDTGVRLDAIRARLDGAGVHELAVDGEGTHLFVIPARVSAVRLLSRHGHASGDARRLGVAISRLTLDGVDRPLDHVSLAAGWHTCERAWRWTDGAALVLTCGAKAVAITVAAQPYATAA